VNYAACPPFLGNFFVVPNAPPGILPLKVAPPQVIFFSPVICSAVLARRFLAKRLSQRSVLVPRPGPSFFPCPAVTPFGDFFSYPPPGVTFFHLFRHSFFFFPRCPCLLFQTVEAHAASSCPPAHPIISPLFPISLCLWPPPVPFFGFPSFPVISA